MKKPEVLQLYALLFLGVLSISVSPIIISVADAPGMVTTYYRLMIPSIILAPWVLLRMKKALTNLGRRGFLYAAGGGVAFGCDMLLWSTGVKGSGPTIPTLFANTAPLWVGFGSLLFLKLTPAKNFWVGVLISLMGLPVFFGISSISGTGPLYGTGAGIFYAIFMLLAQEGRKTTHPIIFFWISTFSGALFLLGVNLGVGNSLVEYSGTTFAAFIFSGIISQLVTWLTLNYIQGHLPAVIISPTLLAQPVVAGLISFAFLDERFTTNQIIGAVIIIGGILIIHFRKKRPKEKQINQRKE